MKGDLSGELGSLFLFLIDRCLCEYWSTRGKVCSNEVLREM